MRGALPDGIGQEDAERFLNAAVEVFSDATSVHVLIADEPPVLIIWQAGDTPSMIQLEVEDFLRSSEEICEILRYRPRMEHVQGEN